MARYDLTHWARAATGAIAALVVACATLSPSVPNGYAGPMATLRDSMASGTHPGTDFFFLDSIDGQHVDNSLVQTTERNRHRDPVSMGLMSTPYLVERPVPAREATFHIAGRTHFPAPIQEMVHKIYRIEGDVRFAPEPDHLYVVTGELTQTRVSVWIEDGTGHLMGNKIVLETPASRQ